jgi:E3 ubiquitin-protein ligase DOA10
MKAECRYCLSFEKSEEFIIPCKCEGSIRYVHQSCLEEWIKNSKKDMQSSYDENRCLIYSIDCELCKYKMKCYPKFENNQFVSLLKTIKCSINSIQGVTFLFLHAMVLYYFFNKLNLLIYQAINLIYKNFKSKYLMRLANEASVFLITLWFAGDILRYYLNLYFTQRKTSMHFVPREEIAKD